jgi:hypothetical protein
MVNVVPVARQSSLKETLRVGDEIRIDPNYRFAISILDLRDALSCVTSNAVRPAFYDNNYGFY